MKNEDEIAIVAFVAVIGAATLLFCLYGLIIHIIDYML